MHNCHATQASLVDLVFEETSPVEGSRLRAELKSCGECRARYASLTETLGFVGRSFELQKPHEAFWTEYHARLESRLNQFAFRRSTTPNGRLAGFWRVFLTPLRVPIPVAAAFVLMFLVSILFAVRPRQPVPVIPVIVATPAPPPRVETRTVNVPVVQERVVTRVVYVDRSQGKDQGAAGMNRVDKAEPGKEKVSPGAALSLAGFRPTNQVKLTVIKGSYRDEK